MVVSRTDVKLLCHLLGVLILSRPVHKSALWYKRPYQSLLRSDCLQYSYHGSDRAYFCPLECGPGQLPSPSLENGW